MSRSRFEVVLCPFDPRAVLGQDERKEQVARRSFTVPDTEQLPLTSIPNLKTSAKVGCPCADRPGVQRKL